MRAWVLLREGIATTWANKVPSALVTIIVAVMVAATLATVGRTAAAEELLSQRLDSAGSRLLAIADTRSADLLGPAVITQSNNLSVAERAVGIVAPIDVVNGAIGQGGERAPSWGVIGDMAAVAHLTAGRWPLPGEALVSAAAQDMLGLTDAIGFVTQASTENPPEFAIVGAFTPREPFENFQVGVLYNGGDEPSDSLQVILNRPDQATVAQDLVLGLIAPPEPRALRITSPIGLAELRSQVVGDMTTFGRTLLLGVMGSGALLTAIIVLADVLVRRKDLGRRRALGATRSNVVALVVSRTVVPSLLGAAIGTAAGLWLSAGIQTSIPTDFVAGVIILAVLAAVLSAIPPALYAATRDPVRVLRTP